jgi:hypothetical protein
MKKVATQAGPNYVVKEEVPRYLVSASPMRDPEHERAIRQLWRWIGGRLTPRFHFAAAAFVTVVILVSLTFLRQLLRPSSACPRCGMAACRRCNPEMPDQHLCGQCFHSFVSLEGVDPQSRVKKEIEVHRFQARSLRVRRIVSLMIVGAGQLLIGRSLVGVLLLAAFIASVLGAFLAAGIIPDPAPYAAPASTLSGVLAWLIAVTVYGAGLWDAQRSEGG